MYGSRGGRKRLYMLRYGDSRCRKPSFRSKYDRVTALFLTFTFIPVCTTCYDDSTKDYSRRAASKVVLDNPTHFKETVLKLCNELRPNLILKTGGTGINSDDITPETNTPLVEDQCVVINIGTKLPDTRR
ncbi:unnamed protein product, partial [Rotaria magnacalcarata]